MALAGPAVRWSCSHRGGLFALAKQQEDFAVEQQWDKHQESSHSRSNTAHSWLGCMAQLLHDTEDGFLKTNPSDTKLIL